MSSRYVYLTVAVLPLFLVSCSNSDWHPEPVQNSKLAIKVYYSSVDSEQGYSGMQVGAFAAKETDDFKKAANYIELQIEKDPDSPEEAARIARRASLSPDVLAVIGHSRSGTTRAAMPFYAQAGIPVLMPTATSPYVLYPFDERDGWPSVAHLKEDEKDYPRFTNAFRLRPSDVPDQVTAMKLTLNKLVDSAKPKIERKAKSELGPKIVLICDTTSRNGSDVYTKPMCDDLRNDADISPKIASYRPFSVDGDIYGLVTEIHAAKPDYIIILGYPELARDVLEELTERMQKGQKALPYKFILTDASLQNYLTKFSNDIYVTSSFNGGQAKRCEIPLAKSSHQELRAKKPDGAVLQDESYTFDAVLILAKAVNSCDAQVSRTCVMEYIEKHHAKLEGACETYFVENGERQNAAFNVSSVCGGAFKVRWLARVSGNDLEENPNWCKQGHR